MVTSQPSHAERSGHKACREYGVIVRIFAICPCGLGGSRDRLYTSGIGNDDKAARLPPSMNGFRQREEPAMTATLLEPTARAQSLLNESGQHELRRLSVTETEESILIEGRVTRFYLKQLAQEVVRSATDGRRLINRVCVDL